MRVGERQVDDARSVEAGEGESGPDTRGVEEDQA